MFERADFQLFFAIVVTVAIAVGLAWLGANGFANISGEYAPIAPTLERLQPLQQGGELNAITLSTSSATTMPTVDRAKSIAMVTPTAGATVSATATVTLARPGAKTPTPIRVVVSTQKRSWVYYHGPATYVRADAFAPLPLASFPRPTNDNGRGLHWFPTTYQTRAVVDRFIPELNAMKIQWLVILQGMDDWNMVANDYLIDQLLKAGIMPIVRIDRQVGKMDWGRLGWIVARYRERGVRYFQLFNEPNAIEEWGTSELPTPEQFVTYWIQGAEVIAANGGFPGFAPMSPQPDDSDLVFFQAALEELKRLGRFDLANLMWVSIHNYGDFDPGNPTDDGFFRYRSYDTIVRKVFGGSLPLIITEGGPGDAESMANVIAPMYRFVMSNREPYLFAFAPWLIGNAVGGGHDPRWESAAWYTGTLSQVRERNVVAQAKTQ
ncbi:hypothetical protein ANRL3_01982 [Anaerolineae bacterium]|nr:hypothetical protein ANRL3_01982 [Anaerolineae bacterium]